MAARLDGMDCSAVIVSLAFLQIWVGGSLGVDTVREKRCTDGCCEVEQIERPMIEEYVGHIPVLKKNIAFREEEVVRHVPVIETVLSTVKEKKITHVPVVGKTVHQVEDWRTRHVPVICHRLRTIEEPYTSHVRVTQTWSRPVEEEVLRHVPVVETRCTPVVTEVHRTVPVTETRQVPVSIEDTFTSVPVKGKKLVGHCEEHKVSCPKVEHSSNSFAETFH